LGVVSKNSESVAWEAIDRHPEMVLRRDDFVAWRINWQDKAQNLRELAEEVNLGLDSLVFIDDHPAERARVRAALPTVLVPEWPEDKLRYAQALMELTCFDPAAVTSEDLARSGMYLAERQRKTAQHTAQTVEAYLESLQLRVAVEPLNKANLSRATQLLNKTNQMNLATRRMTEAEFEAVLGERSPVFVFRVADRFGDYGLTGIASLNLNGDFGAVADFVVSCRVMGRGVEESMLHVLTEHARRRGIHCMEATYLPTERNTPIRSFFDKTFGPLPSHPGDPVRYSWTAVEPFPLPKHLQIQFAADLWK
jgi:FkbH-like protein